MELSIIRFLRYLKARCLPPSSRSFHAAVEESQKHYESLQGCFSQLAEGIFRLEHSGESAAAWTEAQLNQLAEGISRLEHSGESAAAGTDARLNQLAERLLRLEQNAQANCAVHADLLAQIHSELIGLRMLPVEQEHSTLVEAQVLYGLLADDFSQKLFTARVIASVSNTYGALFRALTDVERNESKPDILTLLKRNRDGHQIDCFVLCPVSERTRMLKRSMEELGIHVEAFCTEKPMEPKTDETRVINYEMLAAEYGSCIVLLENNFYFGGLAALERVGFSREQVFIDCVNWAPEYFGDLLTPLEHEVFVDGGAYDGDTIRDFLNWNGGTFDRLLAFEPDSSIYERCVRSVEPLADPRIEMKNAALWDQNMQIPFESSSDMGSHADENAAGTAKAVRLDDVLAGQPATLIKLDVEGAELHALIGAAQTIRRCKPRLLVCVYHKPEDILQLILYIKKLNPAYELYLRHCGTSIYDTLLIAK